MKCLFPTALVFGFCASLVIADEARVKTTPEPKQPETACHGTAVEFVSTPVEAAKVAAQQKKLVLVLHVSGHFEDPDFT